MMRKFSAVIALVVVSCSCACASVTRDDVNSAWRKITNADNFPQSPIVYEDTNSVNAWGSLDSQNNFTVHVTAGLMNLLGSDEEIAGVLAHELGHIKLGHYTDAEESRIPGKASSVIWFSRAKEDQADDYAITLLKKAGYNVYGLYNAMRRTVDSDSASQSDMFPAHPLTARRLVRLQNKAQESAATSAPASKPAAPAAHPAAAAPESPRIVSVLPAARPAAAVYTPAAPLTVRPAATKPVSPAPTRERLTIAPGAGVTLQGTRTYSGVVMAAYQKAYAMNFEVWKPADLPAGWYATFDGFPVAQIAENRWVYGQLGVDATIRPTNILVGSVVPSSVPGIARIAAVWSYGKSIDSPEFQKIRKQMCNRMGWLNDGHINTIIAWNTSRPGVWIWLGNRWRKFTPRVGEYTWQMIKRLRPYIAEELHKNHAWYQGGEPLEVADLARQWGYIWGGRVILESIKAFQDSNGSDGGQVTSFRESSSSGSSKGNSAPPSTPSSGPRWDVD